MGTDFVSVIMELECERVIVLHSREREGEREGGEYSRVQ